jgi:ABC-type glycerol-3-phosphate transport system substrate-binding protein
MYYRILRVISAVSVFILVLQPFLANAQETAFPIVMEEDQSFELDLKVTKADEYLLLLEYMTVTSKSTNPQMIVKLKGDTLNLSYSATLPRIWEDIRDSSRFATDNAGNEFVPHQREIFEKQKVTISFIGGGQPVALNKGTYKLTLTMASCAIKLFNAGLVPVSGRSSHEYENLYRDHPVDEEEPIYIEAELPSRKSSAGIIATYDNSSPAISPSAPDRIVLGLTSTGVQEGQWIEWTFNAEKAGWYRIVFGYRQNSMRGLGVRRQITLDGEKLFDELDEVVFPYTESFATLCPSDGDSPYLIYLKRGKHTIRLTVNLGELVFPLNELAEAVSRMNKVYRDIIMVTGTTPDVYRDYYLEDEIPTLLDDLKYCRDTLNSAARKIEQLSAGHRGSETAAIDEAIRVIEEMIKKPHRIPNRLTNYKSQLDAVANQSVYLRQQPLELDTIEFLPAETQSRRVKHGLFQKIIYRLKVFLQSFVQDYIVVKTGGGNEPHLKVWISVSELQVTGSAAGREQMQVLKRLWSEESDQPVEFSLVNTNDVITQAIISGKGPDVALFVPEQTMINLAVRGALADLLQVENIEEIKQRFHPSALVIAEWNGGLYSLPETQNWFMLFCRTDILKSCGLSIPQTWDELYYALQALRQRNMMVAIPEDQRVFEMLLMQQGGSVYNDDLTATRLTEDIAVSAFTAWTDFFVKHSTPVSYDFYNRFRTGEMPLGLADYTLYNQLQVAAPELQGLWDMVPVPGFKRDGRINRCQPCNVNGCVVVESSRLKEQAFDFVDWWTSDRVQERFGQEIEIILGAAARYNTANIKAAAGLNWTDKELKNLEAVRSELWDVKLTPASYYYNRNILNSFRRVVYNYENPRDVLGRYSREIDRELERKNAKLLGGR